MGRALARHEDADAQFLNEAMQHVIENCGAQLRVANTELLAARLCLQEVSARLLSAKDEERRRISRELDGGTVQLLAAIQLRLLDALCSEDQRVARIGECLRILDQAVVQIRALAATPRPPAPDDRAGFPMS